MIFFSLTPLALPSRRLPRRYAPRNDDLLFPSTDSNGGSSREVTEVGLLQSKIVGAWKWCVENLFSDTIILQAQLSAQADNSHTQISHPRRNKLNESVVMRLCNVLMFSTDSNGRSRFEQKERDWLLRSLQSLRLTPFPCLAGGLLAKINTTQGVDKPTLFCFCPYTPQTSLCAWGAKTKRCR